MSLQNCQKIAECLEGYLLGDVEPEIEIQINEHLLVCHDCRKKLEALESLVELFRKKSIFKPSQSVYEKVRRQIRIKQKSFLPGTSGAQDPTLTPALSLKKGEDKDEGSLRIIKIPIHQGCGRRILTIAASFLLGMILMRAVDLLLFTKKTEKPAVEMRYETRHRYQYSDSIQFYSVPPKNLARI
ncbi:MAG: hypothetical protein ABIL70_05095 [candidate division WOR-3 bacterium]